MRRINFTMFLLLYFLIGCSQEEESLYKEDEQPVMSFSNSLYDITFEKIELYQGEKKNNWSFHFSIASKDNTRSLSPEKIYIDFPEELSYQDVSLERKDDIQIERDVDESHILRINQLYAGDIGEETSLLPFHANLHVEQPNRMIYFENIEEEDLPIIRDELLLESIAVNAGEVTIKAADIFDMRHTSWSLIVNDEKIYPVTSYTISQSSHHHHGIMEFAVFPDTPFTLVAERIETFDLNWELDFLLPLDN